MEKYVLVSVPRSGSSWVQTYVTSYMKNNHNFVKPILKDERTEYFARDLVHENSFIDLEESRKNQREFCIKYHIEIIRDCTPGFDWFNEFYKDFKVILMDRDPFDIFCSRFYFYNKTSRDVYEEIDRIYESLDCFKYVDYSIRWSYEELSDEFLQDFFKVKPHFPKPTNKYDIEKMKLYWDLYHNV